MDNISIANKIMRLLGFKRRYPAILNAMFLLCPECDRYGPPDGKPCASLQMAIDNGFDDYEPPEWCKDPETMMKRSIKKAAQS